MQMSEAQTNQREEVTEPLNVNQPVQLMEENQPSRTVTFQDWYDALTPSTSRHETIRGDPNHVRGFQTYPQLQEC